MTYAFLHGDLNHLVFNSIWLLAFGTPVARRFGTWRFLAFFAATAAGGALVHLATHFGQLLPMIGASAAISGAMAAAMRFAFQRGGPLALWRSHDDDAYRVPAASLKASLRDPRVLAFLLVWFGVNALMGSARSRCRAWSMRLPGRRISAASLSGCSPLRCLIPFRRRVRATATKIPDIRATNDPPPHAVVTLARPCGGSAFGRIMIRFVSVPRFAAAQACAGHKNFAAHNSRWPVP